MRFRVFNYDKASIRVQVESPCAFSVKCESLSSSGTYIQYYAAYVRFYYVKCLERQRKPLSIYDSDLNEYNCVESNPFEVVCSDSDTFEVRLQRNVKEIEADFNAVEIKKAVVSLKPTRLSDVEEMMVMPNDDGDGEFVIIDLNQEFVNVNLNENGQEKKENEEANGMSKKDFMLKFSTISTMNGDHLDEDDDEECCAKQKSESLEKGKFKWTK